MTAAGLLARAQAAGLAVVAEGGNLRLRGQVKPPADLLAELRAHKAEVVALLTATATDPAPPPPPLPTAPAALLTHLRDVLHCQVTVEADRVAIWPPHRCGLDVLAAVQAVLPAVRTILEAEAADFLDAVLGAGGDGDAIPLDLRAGQVLSSDASGAAALAPSEEHVEALAMVLLARADASPATMLPDREAALRYFRSQARSRLASTNDRMVRGLLVGFERHRARGHQA